MWQFWVTVPKRSRRFDLFLAHLQDILYELIFVLTLKEMTTVI